MYYYYRMTRPDLRELESFVAVAEHLNFSRAARQLNLSQPPLTRHIKSLEAKLGVQLFLRDTHSVTLTEPGKFFLEDARAVLNRLDQAGESIRRAKEGEVERLRLAFVGALLDQKLVSLLQKFRQTHLSCQIQMVDLPPAAQLEAIRSGEVDGGFIGALPSRSVKDIEWVIWQREPLLLCLPERHPLARVKTVDWSQLVGESWVMVSTGAAPAFRQQFSDLCKEHLLKPRVIQETDRVAAVLTMVAADNGLTMVPQTTTHLITKGVVFRPLPPPHPELLHTFAYRAEEQLPALQRFLSLLKREI